MHKNETFISSTKCKEYHKQSAPIPMQNYTCVGTGSAETTQGLSKTHEKQVLYELEIGVSDFGITQRLLIVYK